jgi:hypothetical protein
MGTNDVDQFWRDYEAKTGEKVLKFSLGRYVTGWKGFREPLWGLAIVTEGGFRFHHFPHEGWIIAMSRIGGGGGAAPTEKTLFVPREKFRAYEVRREKSLLKRLFTPASPKVELRYADENGDEAVLVVELDHASEELENALGSLFKAG